jgi:Protein of unknown function (DUF2591)
MVKIHIDQATNAQLDYAVAVAQGWIAELSLKDNVLAKKSQYECRVCYSPTTNQAQCGELIDKFKIATDWVSDEWAA